MLTTEKEFISTEVLTFVIVVVVGIITWKWFSQRHLPPGPWGLPFVGYLPFIGNKPELTFVKLGERYGNIFSLRLGQRLVVVLNDYSALNEALVKQGSVFISRPPGFVVSVNDDEKGILLDGGESYLKNRHFIISTLRDFGMGKTDLEPIIKEEIQKCLDIFAKSNGKSIDPRHPFSLGTANVVFAMTLGKRFEYDDPKLEWLIQLTAQFGECIGILSFRQFFPIFRYLPFSKYILSKQFNKLKEIKSSFRNFHLDIIKKHEKNPSEDIRDFIDAYLSPKSNSNEKDLDYLVGTLEALFVGGTQTVAASLRWALLYLTANPSIQTKVQAEIDAVIGSERLPSMKDQSQMNYTKATIMETHRCASLAPLGLVRGNVEEATIQGYQIPIGTHVIPNLWAIHYDDHLWEDPTSFKPERFLDANGIAKKPDYLVPFVTGKRSCVGEELAIMELFLFLTSLFQRFTFQSDVCDARTFSYHGGVIRIPDLFTVRAVQRDSFKLA